MLRFYDKRAIDLIDQSETAYNKEIQTHVSSSDMALDCTNLPDVP